MRKYISRKDIPYFVVTLVLGTISHFLYEYSGKNPFMALISPVNESVWEHLKLVFFPVFLVTAMEYFIHKSNKSALWGARLAGAWMGMAAIVLLFYGYTAVLGREVLVIDILLFAIGVFITFFMSERLGRYFRKVDEIYIFLGWLCSILLFFVFTAFPPEMIPFTLPENGK